MRIRTATPDDVPAVAALEASLFGLDAWTTPGVADELDASRRLALVAVDDDTVAGYAVVALSGDVADLHRVAVAPAARRRGVATALLAALRDASRGHGASRMLLEVSAGNETARAFYAAEGWAELDRRPAYYRDGSDALVLSLALTREPV